MASSEYSKSMTCEELCDYLQKLGLEEEEDLGKIKSIV